MFKINFQSVKILKCMVQWAILSHWTQSVCEWEIIIQKIFSCVTEVESMKVERILNFAIVLRGKKWHGEWDYIFLV